MDRSLGRQNRINRNFDYQQVLASGSHTSGQYWRLVAARSTNPPFCPRLGLRVPKKACRKAVGRSSAKRVAREAFRANKDFMKCFDYVLLARTGQNFSKQNKRSLRLDLERLLNRFA